MKLTVFILTLYFILTVVLSIALINEVNKAIQYEKAYSYARESMEANLRTMGKIDSAYTCKRKIK